MDLLLHLILAAVALPVVIAGGYLLLLTLLSAPLVRPEPHQRDLCFDIVVPAHNETAVIERTVRSLCAVDWPAERFRVLVVADNCDDDTAQLARTAGACVIERHDTQRRGKGYALEYGFAHSRADGRADAVVVIDADTVVSSNILAACAARIEAGAQAVMLNYGVLNPEDSWRTRMITMAYGAFHIVRSRARERLGLSCGLRGNGMCFTHALLERFPFQVYSIAEDLEYGIRLGLAGIRIHYADEAHADGEIIASERGARSQRQRWERGRFSVIRDYTGPLLADAFRQRSALSFDLAMDLLVLPLSYVVLQMGLLLLLSAIISVFMPSMLGWVWLSLALIAAVAVYVFRGWQVSGLGPTALLDLLRAPFFVIWKLVTMMRDRGRTGWVKTERETPADRKPS